MKLAHIHRLLEVSVAIILIAGVYLPTHVSAAGAVIVSVSAPTQAVNSGQQFMVNINVQPNNAITGAQFNLSFNPSLVTVNSVTEGNLFNQSGAGTYFMSGTINNTAGTVTGVADAIIGSGQSVSNPGTFAVITMTARTTSGTSNLNLSNVIAADSKVQSLSVTLVNGQVVISGGQTTTTTPTTTTTTTPAPPGGDGGGGGAVILSPTSVAGVTNYIGAVDTKGVLNQDVNAWSDDNNILLHIPAGSAVLAASGTALTQISMIHMTKPPAFQAGAGIVSLAYDFIPAGTTFIPAATMRLSYDPTLIPAGVAESSLQIAYYDSAIDSWITLPSTVDIADHFIYAQIAHFTPYAVTYGVKVVPPAPTTTTTVTTTSVMPIPMTTTAGPNITTPTHTPIEITTPALTETTPTAISAGVTTIAEPPTTTNNPPSTNKPVVRMDILVSAIAVAVFLIAATTTFIWLRHRKLSKTGNR